MSKRRNRTRLLVVMVVAVVGLALGYVVTRGKTQTQEVSQKPIYIALGDSIAAGQGLQTDSDSSACYRTNEAYPNLVADKLDLKLNNLACSGASIKAGLTGPQVVNSASLPAQNSQIQALKPNVITVTIGANDVNWLAFILQCYITNCGTTQDKQLTVNKLNALRSDLQNLLATLRENTNAQIFVTGYYDPYPPTSSKCTAQATLNDTKLNWLQSQTKQLNDTISSEVAKHSGTTFVPVDFTGHELCTKDPWVQDFSTKAPFHPTTEGQTAIAEAVVKAYRR